MSEFDNMHESLKRFVRDADILLDNWDNEYPTVYQDRRYPEYLPSFDEFVLDMQSMIMEEEDQRYKAWKETIK